jgi:hypothetical protein
MTLGKKLLSVAGLLFLAGSMTLYATEDTKKQEKTAETVAKLKKAGDKDKAETGISANDLIKKAYAYIGNLEKYSFEATIVNEDDLGGADMLIYLRHHYKVSVLGPDKLRMDVRGDTENANMYFNNGNVSILDADKKSYAQVKVSTDIDDALDDLMDTYGVPVPLTQFIYSDMDEDINASTKGYYLGTVYIDDNTPCYYIAFPGKEWDVQFWIEKGDKPLIRKVSYVDKKKKGQPRSMITLHWNLISAIDEKIFDFKAPEGAIKAKVLTLEEAKKLKKKLATQTDAQAKDEK